MPEPTDAVTTGMELRLLRVQAGVAIGHLAVHWGVTRNTVTKYETRATVKPDIAHRYRLALQAAHECNVTGGVH